METGDPRGVVERGELRSERRRRVPVLLPILVVLAVVCAGLIAVFKWYNSATELERENPVEVLQQYLNMRFNSPAPSRLEYFICSKPDLADIENVLDELATRERNSAVDIEVGIANFAVEANGKSASVRTDLSISYRAPANLYRESQEWQFNFVEEDGWRICGARRV